MKGHKKIITIIGILINSIRSSHQHSGTIKCVNLSVFLCGRDGAAEFFIRLNVSNEINYVSIRNKTHFC